MAASSHDSDAKGSALPPPPRRRGFSSFTFHSDHRPSAGSVRAGTEGRVESYIGKDGMPIAVKSPHGRGASLERECKIWNRIYEDTEIGASSINDNDGELQLVMPEIMGRTMQEMLLDPNISILEKIHIWIVAAQFLQNMHNKGVVHNDPKPDNIIIQMEETKGSRDYKAIYVDFGQSAITNADNKQPKEAIDIELFKKNCISYWSDFDFDETMVKDTTLDQVIKRLQALLTKLPGIKDALNHLVKPPKCGFKSPLTLDGRVCTITLEFDNSDNREKFLAGLYGPPLYGVIRSQTSNSIHVVQGSEMAVVEYVSKILGTYHKNAYLLGAMKARIRQEAEYYRCLFHCFQWSKSAKFSAGLAVIWQIRASIRAVLEPNSHFGEAIAADNAFKQPDERIEDNEGKKDTKLMLRIGR